MNRESFCVIALASLLFLPIALFFESYRVENLLPYDPSSAIPLIKLEDESTLDGQQDFAGNLTSNQTMSSPTYSKSFWAPNTTFLFPRFENVEQVRGQWKEYLDFVYGLDTLRFPLDTRNFTAIHSDWPHLIPGFVGEPRGTDTRYGEREIGEVIREQVGSKFGPWSRMLITDASTTSVFAKSMPNGFPSHAKIEVLRLGNDGIGVGSWFHPVFGSGFYYDLGRTIVFNTHKEACQFFNGSGTDCKRGPNVNNFNLHNGHAHGYDSIQYLRNAGIGGIQKQEWEVQDTRLSDDEEKVRQKWHAKLPLFRGYLGYTRCIPKQTIVLSCEKNNVNATTAAGRSFRTLNVLFTSDLHGYLPDPQFVASMRSKRANTLLFDVGDLFVGSREFQQNGPIWVADYLRDAKYDAITLGNHDLEYYDSLEQFKERSQVQILSVNLEHQQNYHVFSMDNGLRVGVLGYTDFRGVNLAEFNESHAQVEHILSRIIDTENELKVLKHCDFVILLAHGSIADNEQILRHVQSNIILGGHSHKVYGKLPLFHCFENLCQLTVKVLSDGTVLHHAFSTINLPRKKDKSNSDSNGVDARKNGQLIAMVDGTNLTSTARSKESFVVVLVARLMRKFGDISIREVGSVRAALKSGRLYDSDLKEILPWNNKLIVVRMSLSELRHVISQSKVRLVMSGINLDKHCISRPRDLFDLREPEECVGPFRDNDKFEVVMTEWIYNGGDSFGNTFHKFTKVYETSQGELEVLFEFDALLTNHSESESESQLKYEKASKLQRSIGGFLGSLLAHVMLYPIEVCITHRVIGSNLKQWHARGMFLAACSFMLSSLIFWVIFTYLSPFSPLLASVVGGIGNICVTTPMWNLVYRMQVSDDTVSEIYHQVVSESDYGIFGFYNGFSMNFLLLAFPVVQTNIQLLLAAYVSQTLAGGFSTALATIVSFPLIVIRTRLALGHDVHVPMDDKKSAFGIVQFYFGGLSWKLAKSFVTGVIIFGFREWYAIMSVSIRRGLLQIV